MHDVGLALEILLDGPHPTLWDSNAKRESIRFIRKRGDEIPLRALHRLVRAILEGPPRDRYRESLSDREWADLRDREIRLRLFKLEESGAVLPKNAKRVLDRIQRELPWQPRGDQSEEFSVFMGTGGLDRSDPGVPEDFAAMSGDSFVEWAEAQSGAPWECGGGWHLFAANEPRNALTLLKTAAMRAVWPIPPWYSLLSRSDQARRVPKVIERAIANLLLEMPREALTILDLQAARWLESVRGTLPKIRRHNLWRRIWDASLWGDPPEGALDFDLTHNHAGGVLGEVLYIEMAEYIPEVGPGANPGLPSQLRSDFDTIAEDDSPSAKLARVRIVPRLYILHRIDPKWTAHALLRRMDPDDVGLFDPYLWEGYLWHARWSDDLVVAVKDVFLKVLRNLDRISDRVRLHGPQLFIHLAIPPDRGITTNEAKGVLFTLGPDNLAVAAWAIKDMLHAAGDKSPTLWRETIGPWFDEAWPKHRRDRSEKLSEKLAWMAIDSGDAFPDVVDAIEGLLTQEKWESALFHLAKKEEEVGLVTKFPRPSLRLADKLVGDRTLPDSSIKALLDAVNRADPAMKKTAAFKRLTTKAL